MRTSSFFPCETGKWISRSSALSKAQRYIRSIEERLSKVIWDLGLGCFLNGSQRRNLSVQNSCLAGITSHCQEIHSRLTPVTSPKYILQSEQSEQKQEEIHTYTNTITLNCFLHCGGVKKSPWSSWSFCKNTRSNTSLVKSFLWYIGSERLQHRDHNSLLLLENKSYSKWHEMKVGKGRESGDISRNRKGIIAFQDWFCLNSACILQTHTQPSFTSPAGSQGVGFLTDKIM